MGDFTTTEKVKSLFRRIKIEPDTGDESQNTVITTEEVEEFIAESEANVKARLSKCYDMSAVGTESVLIIGQIVKYRVAQIIKNILELTTKNSESKTQIVTSNWDKKADEMIEQICPKANCNGCKQKPTLPLPDTPLAGEPPVNANLFNSASNTPVFKKNSDNW